MVAHQSTQPNEGEPIGAGRQPATSPTAQPVAQAIIREESACFILQNKCFLLGKERGGSWKIGNDPMQGDAPISVISMQFSSTLAGPSEGEVEAARGRIQHEDRPSVLFLQWFGLGFMSPARGSTQRGHPMRRMIIRGMRIL